MNENRAIRENRDIKEIREIKVIEENGEITRNTTKREKWRKMRCHILKSQDER